MEDQMKEDVYMPMAASSDREALLDDIMQNYGQDILQLVYTYVKNRAIAEDLTQDIFLKCYQKFDQFHHQSSIKTWIYRIAINHCKDYLRSWHYRKVVMNEKVIGLMPSREKRVDEKVVQKSSEQQLADAVMQLPMKYREVIFLFYFEELTLEEISSTIHVNINTIKTRLKRAREILKTMVKEEHEYGE